MKRESTLKKIKNERILQKYISTVFILNVTFVEHIQRGRELGREGGYFCLSELLLEDICLLAQGIYQD